MPMFVQFWKVNTAKYIITAELFMLLFLLMCRPRANAPIEYFTLFELRLVWALLGRFEDGCLESL